MSSIVENYGLLDEKTRASKMITNYIGGGQVFLHKVRMLRQVVSTTILVSILIGVSISYFINTYQNQDWDAAITYTQANLLLKIHPALSKLSSKKKAKVDAYSNGKLYKKQMRAKTVLNSHKFKTAYNAVLTQTKQFIIQSTIFSSVTGCIIFLIWSKFGNLFNKEQREDDDNKVLTASEVKKKLKKLKLISNLTIGKMPLVKNTETRHFLVTGSTGSGKTNLIHTLLSQVQNQSAILIDQTGEMISKYYNKYRGDIIFNPFDDRSSTWNFQKDCNSDEEIERFSRILINFGKQDKDPFWSNAAIAVFNACAKYVRDKEYPIDNLIHMTCNANLNHLSQVLANTEAAPYLCNDSKQTASSILSVLAASSKPISFLQKKANNPFSLKEYFNNVKQGKNSWLFLATKPSNRALTLPLISCMTELALARLMEIGINKDRRVWYVIDELPALGKLPALSPIMSEGRKYGACVIAGLQSLNQLYQIYGQYSGSAIFGQFGTSFFFRSTEQAIARMVSSICGTETITRQQKNTSFGANTFRDGISYSEQQNKKPLIEQDDLAKLKVGECYALLPEPKVRVAKIQTKEMKMEDRNEGFVERSVVNRKEGAKHNQITLEEELMIGDEGRHETRKEEENKEVKNIVLEV